jgi:hypothetical protein
MPKVSILLLVAVALTAPALQAQQAAVTEKTKSPQKAATAAAPETPGQKKEIPASKPGNSRPAETSAEATKKPGFIGRIFGKGKKGEPEAPAPAPKPTPKPTAKTATPPSAQPPGAATTDSGKKAGESAAGAEGPAAAADRPAGVAIPKGKKGAKNAAISLQNKPETEEGDPEEIEKKHYDLAKAKAMETPEILALKEKADNASSDEESRRALRSFNKALFNKIRQIDPTIKDRADRVEAALMKRLLDGE